MVTVVEALLVDVALTASLRLFMTIDDACDESRN